MRLRPKSYTSRRELVLKLDAEKDIGVDPLLADDPASKPQGDAASAAVEGTDSDMPAAPPQLNYEQQVRSGAARDAGLPVRPAPSGIGAEVWALPQPPHWDCNNSVSCISALCQKSQEQ